MHTLRSSGVRPDLTPHPRPPPRVAGGLTLLLQLLEGTLNVPASSPRLKPLQISRLLNTRRLAATALANLAEGHLGVQATMVAEGALPKLYSPLQRHNAAVTAERERRRVGEPTTAAAAAAAAGAATDAGATLDARTREQLLRCLASLCARAWIPKLSRRPIATAPVAATPIAAAPIAL